MATRTVINDRYELQQLPLAKGGMGEVWEGRDVKLDREIAVKFIRFPEGVTDRELVQRFVRESRITARLQHPGVPAVFDVGTHQDRPYLVMQRVHGVSVSDLVAENGPLPLGWAAAIVAQACSVLAVAHAASLVHRDLKPGNLMLEPDGGLKVLDFGLAVALDWTDVSQITRTGQAIGTPAYMAPEQILAATSSPRSDLYSLGCVLHEMLTGRQLFTGSTAYAVMNKQVDERPWPVHRLRPEIPTGLEQLMSEMLAKNPEQRPASAQVTYDRLLPYVEDLGMLPGTLTPPSEPSPVRMYASVLSRVFHAAGEPGTPTVFPAAESTSSSAATAVPDPKTGSSAAGSPSMTRGEIERARAQANSHVKQSRYSQAADVLGAVVASAGRAFGTTDDDVVSLRLDWANILFEGGEYSRAVPTYRALIADLTDRDGADSELVFRCRLQDATCHALTGWTNEALRTMDSLLTDEQRVFGPDDPRTLELRRQIGLLQLGAGQRDRAETTLRELRDDLLRVQGPDHPTVTKIEDVLNGLVDHDR